MENNEIGCDNLKKKSFPIIIEIICLYPPINASHLFIGIYTQLTKNGMNTSNLLKEVLRHDYVPISMKERLSHVWFSPRLKCLILKKRCTKNIDGNDLRVL